MSVRAGGDRVGQIFPPVFTSITVGYLHRNVTENLQLTAIETGEVAKKTVLTVCGELGRLVVIAIDYSQKI